MIERKACVRSSTWHLMPESSPDWDGYRLDHWFCVFVVAFVIIISATPFHSCDLSYPLQIDQLKVLEAFQQGKPVTFKVHNNPTGYKLKKADVPTSNSKQGKVKFTNEDVLHDSVVSGDLAKINALLEENVDVNATDPDGMTPLHRACIENYLNIASTLVSHGADITRQDNDWWTPLHAAASSGESLFSAGIFCFICID